MALGKRSVVGLGPVAMASALVDVAGARRVVVIVKATFDLLAERPAEIAAPAEVVSHDVPAPHPSSPALASIAPANDLAPHLPSAGVVLRGAAHAMLGLATPAMAVRLAIHDGERALLEKTLHVFGERTHAAPTPRPMISMPLVYERAFGGPDVEDNPAGVGSGTIGALPNVVDPNDAHRAAGFGPISPVWASRRRLLGGEPAPVFEGGAMIVGERIDWRYFHAAPGDQQLGYLRGDEWIVLDGLRPDRPRFRAQLPSALGRARFAVSGGRSGDVDLVADTLTIDAERPAASMVWRGQLVLDDRELEQPVLLFGGVELPGHAIAWPAESRGQVASFALPAPPAPRARAAESGPDKPLTEAEQDATRPIAIGDWNAILAKKAVAPFELSAPRSTAAGPDRPQIPGAPWSRQPAAPPPTEASGDDDHTTATLVPPPEFLAPIVAARSNPTPAQPTRREAQSRRPRRSTVPPPPAGQHPEGGRAARASGRAATIGLPAPPPMLGPIVPAKARATAPKERDGDAMEAGRDTAAVEDAGRARVVQRLERFETLEGVEATNANLVGIDLSGKSLVGANLSGAKLDRARLARAVLTGADLTGASLAGALLTDANLSRANLTAASLEGARLERANLAGAKLFNVNADAATFDGATGGAADFSGASLERASFRGADLPGARFAGAKIGGARFDAAALAKAFFARAKGASAVFDGARLQNARFGRADLPHASFRQADLGGANADNAKFVAASFDGATLSRASLVRTSCPEAIFHGADLSRARLVRFAGEAADFREASLDLADLRKAQLARASFAGAAMHRARADRANFRGSDFSGADLRGSSFTSALLGGALCSLASFEGADLRDADLAGTSLQGATLAGAETEGAILPKLGAARGKGDEGADDAASFADTPPPAPKDR